MPFHRAAASALLLLLSFRNVSAAGEGGGACVAVPQDQLPPGSWATTDDQCSVCSTGTHPWWPCDTNLCDCSGAGPTSPVQDVTSAPVNAPTTVTAPPATAAPTPDSGGATAVPSNLPDSGGGGGGDCVAVPQDELPPGSWATTDDQCAPCSTGTHPYWPCDTNLCDCSGAGPTPPVQDATLAPVASPSAPVNPTPLTAAPVNFPTTPAPTKPPTSRSPTLDSAAAAMVAVLEAHKDEINSEILLYQTPQFQWEESSVYRYSDMVAGLKVMYEDGVAGKYFYTGDETENGYLYGIVNLAAFLAQSMKETIKYDACDENSWDLVDGKYPLSNSCGQLGQSYQDYSCSDHEAYMECPVKADMEMTATTNAKWFGAPGPLFCGPKSKYPFTGYWDFTMECNKPWADPPEYCEVYEGQVAGGMDDSEPVANSAGRTDVEGCCFWGRGVIQTTGVCNFGKLNYFLGARAAQEGRDSKYPDVDFCENPDAICGSEEYKELKWIAGYFYWIESLQGYSVDGWDYMTELHKFVDGGMQGNEYIDAVSGIVNRGCHNPPCATGDVDGKSDRRDNFRKVLKTLNVLPATEAGTDANFSAVIKSIAAAAGGKVRSTDKANFAIK